MEATQLMDPAFWGSDRPAAPGSDFQPPVLSGGPLAGLVFFQTSGSTGEPRWIGLSREALLLSAAVVNRHLAVDSDCCWGLALPLHHVGGFGVVARAHEAGARLEVFRGKWDPARFNEWLRSGRVTHGSLVPTQVHDLVRLGLRPPSSLKAIVVGGGVLEEGTGRAARKLGWPVLASYGMTEAGSQVATQPLEVLEQPYVSEPIPVLPHWEVRLGMGNRISLKGPALFAGELLPQDHGWRFQSREGDWFESGDLGSIGEEGLVITGRADTRVKVLGELVDPVGVEAELGCPGVVVVAIPDERSGHRLMAVFEDDAERSRIEQGIAEYNRKVEGFLRIEESVLLETIPRGPLGKVRRGDLMNRLIFRSI